MRWVGFAISVLGTASALIVSAAVVPGVTLTLGGLFVATMIMLLPLEVLGYNMDKVLERRREREDPALAEGSARPRSKARASNANRQPAPPPPPFR